MSIKLVDKLESMGNFPVADANGIQFEDGENLQDKLDQGKLGAGGESYIELSQAEYDALTDEEKVNGKEYHTYDTGHIYKLGIEYGKDTDLSETLVTYNTIEDLNTKKGTSVALVAGEDNTQKIIDALEEKEQFIDWFSNIRANSRFGISQTDYGDTINCLQIVKITSTDASVMAIMNTGAILVRLYKSGTLSDWQAKTHVLNDGYQDDGTLSICGDLGEASAGVYGKGEYYGNLGFSSDIMTWANGIYRISHCTDLTNTPNGLQAGRLEHFNLKRWAGNHNPHNQTYGERMSIWYSVDGNIYTRVQINEGTVGVVTSDTGWRCINQNSKGLVTNAQNFKIDITKKHSAWYGMFTLNFLYGAMLCEMTVVIIDKAYYTITKGQNIVNKITYTQNGANYVFGIDFLYKIYGTQIVEMPSEFGTINSLTAETYAGNTTAILKGYDGKTYTTLAELGLTASATIQNVIDTLPIGGSCLIRTDAFDDTTQFMDVTWGYLKIEKTVNALSKIEIYDVVSDNKLYIGRQSNGKFYKWVALTTITSLSQLGLTADATLNDVIAKLGVGQTATLTTSDFTNYQTLFPYEDEQDAYATVRIEKGYDANSSRTIVTWVRKDASKIAYGGLNASNQLAWWNQYALLTYVNSKLGKNIEQTTITRTSDITTNADYPNYYMVKNGICYFSLYFTSTSSKNHSLSMGLPLPAQQTYFTGHRGDGETAFGCSIDENGAFRVKTNGTSDVYMVSGSYPVK